MPGGYATQLESYGTKISSLLDEPNSYSADPQTSGGLLVSVDLEKKNGV